MGGGLQKQGDCASSDRLVWGQLGTETRRGGGNAHGVREEKTALGGKKGTDAIVGRRRGTFAGGKGIQGDWYKARVQEKNFR